METVQGLPATVDVCGRFEAGEEGPEKLLQGGGGLGRGIDQQYHRPGGHARMVGKAARQIRRRFVGRPLDHQGTRQVGHRPRTFLRQ